MLLGDVYMQLVFTLFVYPYNLTIEVIKTHTYLKNCFFTTLNTSGTVCILSSQNNNFKGFTCPLVFLVKKLNTKYIKPHKPLLTLGRLTCKKNTGLALIMVLILRYKLFVSSSVSLEKKTH